MSSRGAAISARHALNGLDMRIFLAGGTGVIGRRVVPLLLADGHHVTALTRTSAGAAHIRASGATAVVADAFNADQFSAAVSAATPDVVMHQLTDLSGGDRAANAALRVRGTRNLVDAAHAAGVARVTAQSIAWAYTPGTVPAVEATPLDLAADEPRRTTVQAIAALEATGAEAEEWVVLRYGTLYGPDTWLHYDGAMADEARAGRLNVSRDVTSSLHVDDAAAAAIHSLSWPSGPVNICDNEPTRPPSGCPTSAGQCSHRHRSYRTKGRAGPAAQTMITLASSASSRATGPGVTASVTGLRTRDEHLSAQRRPSGDGRLSPQRRPGQLDTAAVVRARRPRLSTTRRDKPHRRRHQTTRHPARRRRARPARRHRPGPVSAR